LTVVVMVAMTSCLSAVIKTTIVLPLMVAGSDEVDNGV
jgi:hypothetical protein